MALNKTTGPHFTAEDEDVSPNRTSTDTQSTSKLRAEQCDVQRLRLKIIVSSTQVIYPPTKSSHKIVALFGPLEYIEFVMISLKDN